MCLEMLKRMWVLLSLKDNIKILVSFKKGETGRKLTGQYGVGTSMMSVINKNTDSFWSTSSSWVVKTGVNIEKWWRNRKANFWKKLCIVVFYKNYQVGNRYLVLCSVERHYNWIKKVGGNELFVEINGWLHKLKCRHGIRE